MQALQVLQAAQSAQAAATSMGMGGAPPPPPASLSVQAYLPGPLKACMGGAPEEDLEGNAGQRTSAPEDVLQCSLFLFVYKAELAMTEQAYVTITVGHDSDGVIYEGPVPKNGTADSTPCWEWHLQVPLELTFSQTTISFKVWGKRLLGDVLMGRQTMTFNRDSFSTVRGPVRETARLRIPVTQPMGIYVMPSCSGPANAEGIGGTLFFSYELTVNSQVRAPLSDVARLGGSNPEKDVSRLWTIDMKTHGALMSRPQPEPVEVRFTLLLPSVPLAKDGVVDKNTYTPITQTVGPISMVAGGDPKWGTYDFTKCADDPALKVHCTEAALMGYVVLVSVHRIPPKEDPQGGEVDAPDSAALSPSKMGFMATARKTLQAVADLAGDDDDKEPEVPTQLGSRVVKIADFLRELLKSGTSVCLDVAMTQGATKTPVGLVRIECDIFHDYARPQCKAPDPATLAQNKDKLLKPDGRCMSRHVLDEAEVQLCDGIGEARLEIVKPDDHHHTHRNAGEGALKFCVNLWADCLQLPYSSSFGGGVRTPKIEIEMGSKAKATEGEGHQAKESTAYQWQKTVKFECSPLDQSAKISLYDEGRFKSIHVATATVMNVRQGNVYWAHLFAGAVYPEDLEVSEEMACGTMRGSTYRGTVVGYFATAERVSPTFVKTEVEKKLRPTSVIVRIDKGIGFRSFRGEAIKILVQVPGCRLPDAATGKQIWQAAKAKEDAGQDQSPNAKADEGKKDKKAPVFNYNLISISGKVDDKGCFKADLVGARRTPQEFPVMLMPGVTHAYLYVVREGEETLSPKIWGTVPLLPYGAQDVLQWQRLEYDQSVYTHKEPLDFETHQAGMLLAGVFLEPVHPKPTQAELEASGMTSNKLAAGPLELPPPVQDILLYEDITDDVLPIPGYFTCCGSYVPKHVGSKGVEFAVADGPLAVKPKNTMMMYCHIDMLAARQLPAREGLCCGYKISIDDTELVMWKPDFAACTDPQWLHRLILPVEVDAERDTHHEMPLVLVELLDFKDFSEGDDKHTAKGIAILSFRAGFWGESSAEDVIDLNTLHCAEWHALKGEQRIPFVEDMHKELVRQDQFVAWKGRPRLLCAAAWSKSKNVKDIAWVKGPGVGGDSKAVWEQVDEGWYTDIKTPAKATFQITIDLLGLRDLPTSVTVDRVVINSFWASSSSGVSSIMDNTGHEFPGDVECPNFKYEEPTGWTGNAVAKTTPDWQVFADSVSDLVKVTNGQGDEVDDTGAIARVSEFVGLRIKVPLYRVPVIPYMDVHYPEETAESALIPHVLLPHIGFNIMENKMIGANELHGYVSVSCAKVLRSGGGPHPKSFVEELLDSVKQVKPEWKNKNAVTKIMDDETGQLLKDPYSVHLDVFAHIDGYLEVNELLRVWEVLWGRHQMGRIKLKQQKEDEDRVKNAGAPGCCKALKRCCRKPPKLIQGEQPHELRFNPHDRDPSNPQGREGPHQSIPTFVCEDRSKKLPMSAKELFDAFMKHKPHHKFNSIGDLELSPKTLDTAYTSQIIFATMRHGWRCQSHLTAPEPEKTLKAPVKNKDPHAERDMRKCLEHNAHTFLRSIGHIITNADRDSRIVARLKVSYPGMGGRPSASNPAEKSREFEQYIFIKFHCPGIVVWAAPDSLTEWASPGMPILAVQLNDDNRSVIVVRTPCFDIRFPGEKSWQVSKTIRRRSNGVRKQLQEAEWAKKEAELQAKDPIQALRDAEQRKAASKRGEATNFTIFQNDLKLTKWKASHLPDGSSEHPIWVHKGGFICRLVKKNSAVFDRLSTKNWYRAMMTPIFPEIGALPEVDGADDPRADVNFVKSYGLCRIMNMFVKFQMADTSSVGGFTDCYLKGHISCKMLKDDEVESATKALEEKPPEELATSMPWDRFWLTESVEVSVNVLTMHGFTGLENGSLRVVMSAGGHDVEKTIESVGITRLGRSETVNVYSGGLVSCTMPAASTLEISVWEVSSLGISTLLGTSYIDVESRWFVMTMINMKERCDPKYLEKAVSPETVKYFARCDDRSASVDGSSLLNVTARGTRHWKLPAMPKEVGATDKQYTKVKPRYVPSCRAPIEVLPMFKGGQSENSELTGQMRCWIELSDSGGARPVMMPDTLRGTDVQLRIRVHDVTNVQVFADSGRNDLKVQVDLVIETVSGQVIRRTMETDVAKMSTERADFNTQWVVKFKAPVLRCSITYTLMDADKFSSSDSVYDPVTCQLDGLFRASQEQGFSLGHFDMPITFMEWPKHNMTSFSKFRTPQREQTLLHAKLRCDIDIVEDFGAETVYEDDKVFTDCYRFSWREGLNQPAATLRLLLGPKHYRKFRICVKCLLPFTCVTLLILITVVAIFYTIQILESYKNIQTS